MRYITNVAIILKGDRIGKGQEVDLSETEASALGTDVSKVGAPEPEEVAVDLSTVPLDDLTFPQLKERAKDLGLSASGSKADIVERIQLHLNN